MTDSQKTAAAHPIDRERDASAELELCYRVPASRERVFDAWTNPEALRQWWGPKGVRCVAAEIDLRVGGQYRIGNELPDKTILWIEGVFEVIEKPRVLEYTWSTDPASDIKERVIVRFESIEDGTKISICHRRIPTTELRDDHRAGWLGCLDGLQAFIGTNA